MEMDKIGYFLYQVYLRSSNPKWKWFIENDAMVTKDNMIKRKWKGNPSCYFYDGDELSNHLFFECKVAKANWGLIARLIGTTNTPISIN